jgi:hypothetical protein
VTLGSQNRREAYPETVLDLELHQQTVALIQAARKRGAELGIEPKRLRDFIRDRLFQASMFVRDHDVNDL